MREPRPGRGSGGYSVIQVVSTLPPEARWQCSRNGEGGSGAMMKQPISSISAVMAGPVAGQASTCPDPTDHSGRRYCPAAGVSVVIPFALDFSLL